MLWYCRYKWQPGVTVDDVRKRIVSVHDAGLVEPEKIRGWYNLTGGGAGFLLYECDDPREVTAQLQPYMDILNWDVHAVYDLPYDETIERFRQEA